MVEATALRTEQEGGREQKPGKMGREEDGPERGDASDDRVAETCPGDGAVIQQVYDDLKVAYKENVRPLEEHYHFPYFFSPILNDVDIEANPFVLLLGQYSVGKTSFVNYLLNSPKGYPGSSVGPEPTTDRLFVQSTVCPAARPSVE